MPPVEVGVPMAIGEESQCWPSLCHLQAALMSRNHRLRDQLTQIAHIAYHVAALSFADADPSQGPSPVAADSPKVTDPLELTQSVAVAHLLPKLTSAFPAPPTGDIPSFTLASSAPQMWRPSWVRAFARLSPNLRNATEQSCALKMKCLLSPVKNHLVSLCFELEVWQGTGLLLYIARTGARPLWLGFRDRPTEAHAYDSPAVERASSSIAATLLPLMPRQLDQTCVLRSSEPNESA